MPILVVGGTSTVGRHLLETLTNKSLQVRSMTRVADNFKQFPSGVQGCVGDLEKPATLRMAFEGAQSVFLTTPLNPDEKKLGLAAAKAAVNAKVKKIVYMSDLLGPDTDHIPHYERKIPIEQAIIDSGIQYTILRPNNFFQNDFWCEAAIMLYNVYPQPLGNKGINRIDARDVADAAMRALLDDAHNGKIYTLHGPQTLTGADTAKAFADFLGREIYYGGDDLDAWAKQARHMMPEWMIQDFRTMYQYFQNHGAAAKADELQAQKVLFPSGLRNFADFVSETVPQWKQEHGQN